jgi:putative membrane protein
LTGGLGQIDAGAGQLATGSARLADGTTAAKAGSGRLAAGATTLANGLTSAADGSGKIATGLGQAAGGVPKIVDGTQQLSDKGAKKLAAAGTTTAETFGELYATMVAGTKRARTEDMAFGAPEGATGLTAYSYTINGADGEGGRNLVRGLGGLAVLGAGGGVFALRRRFV